MADDDSAAIVERGVATVSEETWALATRRAEVIGPLAAADVMGRNAVDQASDELGLSRRQVYVLLHRWRAGDVMRPGSGAGLVVCHRTRVGSAG